MARRFDLSDAWAKLDHANGLFEDLRQSLPDETDLVQLGHRYSGKKREVVYYVHRVADDLEWPLLVGDAVQNMRAALDYLMSQLARRHLGRMPTHKESRRIRYPVCRRKKEFVDASKVYLRYLEPDDLRALKRFQPYRSFPKGYHHPLAALERLSNRDRYRSLRLVAVTAKGGSFTNLSDAYKDCVRDARVVVEGQPAVDWVLTPPRRRPRKGDVVVRCFVRPTGPNPDVELDASVTAHLVIAKIGSVLPALDDMAAYVTAVLEAFDLES
jgi:hypothetical protein